jgi:hypothetical protein
MHDPLARKLLVLGGVLLRIRGALLGQGHAVGVDLLLRLRGRELHLRCAGLGLRLRDGIGELPARERSLIGVVPEVDDILLG